MGLFQETLTVNQHDIRVDNMKRPPEALLVVTLRVLNVIASTTLIYLLIGYFYD